ncbi:MAG: hypothetical protein WD278_15150 [Pirellulales bacterium]
MVEAYSITAPQCGQPSTSALTFMRRGLKFPVPHVQRLFAQWGQSTIFRHSFAVTTQLTRNGIPKNAIATSHPAAAFWAAPGATLSTTIASRIRIRIIDDNVIADLAWAALTSAL